MYFDIEESGKRIKELRLSHGMTQEELSKQLNVGVRYLRRIEKGICGGSIDLLIDISELFHVSLDYLILGNRLQTDKIRQEIHTITNRLNWLENQIR